MTDVYSVIFYYAARRASLKPRAVHVRLEELIAIMKKISHYDIMKTPIVNIT